MGCVRASVHMLNITLPVGEPVLLETRLDK